jgi:FMN phosphatase YigB (HAD superfamily)
VTAGYLVVDLGAVVFDFDHAHRLDRLARVSGLDAERIHALLWLSGFSADCDRGRFTGAAQVRARIRATLNLPDGDDDLDDAWCSAFRPNPAVIDVLDRYRGDRVLALFTNNGPLEEEALARRYPEVLARFDHLFFSHRLGRRKPDPAAFTAVAGHLGASGEEIVFVDDGPANVAAARRAGWRAYAFHGTDSGEMSALIDALDSSRGERQTCQG